jgi:6-pyruvoyltetrahydropterin/6-carboxytetrahydropterin synthase
MEIFKTFTFEAAHRLPNVPPNHKCFRLHGHSYKVTVHVSGDVEEPLGWVVDFADIQKAFGPLFDILDHNYLNEIDGLSNPTSENLASWIWARLIGELPILSKITVQETCTSGCTLTR